MSILIHKIFKHFAMLMSKITESKCKHPNLCKTSHTLYKNVILFLLYKSILKRIAVPHT